MKVCIFDIKRFAIHDGPGIRTTVFFKGCPLECWWCHNPEGITKDIERFLEEVELDGILMEKEVELGRWISVEDLMDELEKDRVFMEESSGGISISGGEPLQQADALFRLLELSGERNFHSTVDTSGYASKEKMKIVSRLADLILFDLKSMDDEKHLKYTGVSNKKIIQNLEIALKGSAEVHLRIPLISGFNDSPEAIESMVDYLEPYKRLKVVDLLPYHRLGSHKYQRFNREYLQNGFKAPTKTRIGEIEKTFEDAGYSVNIGG